MVNEQSTCPNAWVAPAAPANIHDTTTNRDATNAKIGANTNMSEAASPRYYEPPSKVVLRSRVACEACGKQVSLHTLKYRHLCVPMVDRLRRAAAEAHQAVQNRAQTVVEEERASRYAHLFMS